MERGINKGLLCYGIDVGTKTFSQNKHFSMAFFNSTSRRSKPS